MRTSTRLRLLGVVIVGLVAAGCSSGSKPGADKTTSTNAPASKVSGTITVSAAASLTEAFTKLGTDFESANPKAGATFNFGSSGTLEIQIQQSSGAGVDTFASADEDTMNQLVTAGLIDGTPTVFATNRLEIVTKPGNPKHIRTLTDLTEADVVSLCGLTVPCGSYAAQILRTAGVTIPENRVTRGADVKGTLAAVATGDADAAIVYVTDAKSAGSSVQQVTIPDAQNAIASYPIATVKGSANPATSQAWIDYVMSSKAQATLESFGFLPPS